MKDIKGKKTIKNSTNSNTLHMLDRKYFNSTYERFNDLKSTHIPNENIFK